MTLQTPPSHSMSPMLAILLEKLIYLQSSIGSIVFYRTIDWCGYDYLFWFLFDSPNKNWKNIKTKMNISCLCPKISLYNFEDNISWFPSLLVVRHAPLSSKEYNYVLGGWILLSMWLVESKDPRPITQVQGNVRSQMDIYVSLFQQFTKKILIESTVGLWLNHHKDGNVHPDGPFYFSIPECVQ